MSIQETLYKTMDEMLSSANVSDILLIDLVMEIQDLYLLDDKPWVIGFSGGKDSTTILSLIYVAVEKLEPEKDTNTSMSFHPIPW
jgi:DNA sulfur modification protein DndC